MKRIASVVCLLLVLSPVAASAAKKQVGSAVAPIRIVPLAGGTVHVSDLHSYSGVIELRSAPDGIVVVDRLPLERYLLGLNEVPTDWPTQALRAQAVAARTYALYTLAQPRAGAAATYGFDICASIYCQVFAGADVVDTATGGRWIAAVSATAGEAITYRGDPILARYHSTSGGRTLDNPQAFPTEPDYPYLRSVDSRTETGSPLYRWRVEFSRKDLQAILRRAGWIGASTRLESVITGASSQGFHYPDVVIDTNDDTVIRTAQDFREVVGELGPTMFPNLYPSLWPTSAGRLPETLPSNRISIETHGRTIEVLGRGWGHGVGMSQWGAHGLALQGAGYREILTHYYSGTEVGPVADPGEIAVGVDWARRSVEVQGAFAITDAQGKVLVREALGTWGFKWDGTGAIAIDPPRGFGLPLRVGVVHAPNRADPGEMVPITIALSRPARVLLTEDGSRKADPRILEAGSRKITWKAPDDPGVYRVVVQARAGGRSLKAEPVRIEVVAAPAPNPEGLEIVPADDSAPWLLIAGLVLLTAVVITFLAVTIRR